MAFPIESLQWPVANVSVAGFDSASALGSIPGWFVSTQAQSIGAVTFDVTVPNFPDGLGDYRINGTSITITPTGASTTNSPDAYRITTLVNPTDAAFNMSGGTDGLHIMTTVGMAAGNASRQFGPVYSTRAALSQLSGVTTALSAHKVDVSVSAGATAGEVVSLESTASLAGTVTSYRGIRVSPSGASAIASSSDNVKALDINLSGLTGIQKGQAVGIVIEGGKIHSLGNFRASNSLGSDSYSMLINTLEIPGGSPMSGTDMQINNFGARVDAQDDYVINGTNTYGIGINSMSTGIRLSIANGKTVDGYMSMLAGVQKFGAGTGTLTNSSHFVAGIDNSLAAGCSITNSYGFRVLNGALSLSSNSTNAWGVSIEDSGAKNYFAGQVQLGNGTAAIPALTFNSDTNVGLFRPSSEALSVSVNGVKRLTVTGDTTGGVIPRVSLAGPLVFDVDADAAYNIGNDGVDMKRPNTVFVGRYVHIGSGTDTGALQLANASNNSIEFLNDGVGVIGSVLGGFVSVNRRPQFIKVKEAIAVGTSTVPSALLPGALTVGNNNSIVPMMVSTSSNVDGTHQWSNALSANIGFLNSSNNTFYGMGKDHSNDWFYFGTHNATTNSPSYAMISNFDDKSLCIGDGSGANTSTVLKLVGANKGLVLPAATTSGGVATPVEGMVIYDTTANKLMFYNGSAWETVTSA